LNAAYTKQCNITGFKGETDVRILFVTYWYLPHVGGVNTYINVLRKELLKEGHHVDVLAHHTPKNDKIYMLTTGQYIDKAKIKDIVYKKVNAYYDQYHPYVEDWIRWREIERYTFELAAPLFNLNQYDLIHTQDIISTRALSRVKPRHVPLVATIHGLLATEHVIAGDITSKKSAKWEYVLAEEYFGAISADQTIVPTNWLKRKLTHNRIGVPKHALHTIQYGIDREDFLQKYHEQGTGYVPLIEKGKTVFICPARLVPVKGHRYLLEALAILKGKRDDFTCWIVGDGKLSQELQTLSQQLNLQDVVHFLGSRNDVPQLLANSDVLILPSVQDNHPFSIMEAQVAGKLVVASTAGGIPEMVKHGVTGYLFPRKNSRALAEILHYVLTHPVKSKKVARQGKEWGLRHWSPKTLLNNTKRIYKNALLSARKG
jgi:glycosyltransferase involved in cell wall biosynthesis